MPNESVIQVFDDKNVRIMWNEQEEKYYFSIADIVQILTDSTDVKQYIKRMRARGPELDSRWGTICTPTRMRAADYIRSVEDTPAQELPFDGDSHSKTNESINN